MKPMTVFKIIITLFCLSALFYVAVNAAELGKGPKRDSKTNLMSKGVDLSTPEKAIGVFVKAFQMGDDNLLNEVLGPNASLPEFNPIQKIECPSPWITGFNITKLRVVVKKGQYAADSEPGDIEVHVLLKADQTLSRNSRKCMVALWEKGVYLLRSSGDKWRIVAVAPFWPEEAQNDNDGVSE